MVVLIMNPIYNDIIPSATALHNRSPLVCECSRSAVPVARALAAGTVTVQGPRGGVPTGTRVVCDTHRG